MQKALLFLVAIFSHNVYSCFSKEIDVNQLPMTRYERQLAQSIADQLKLYANAHSERSVKPETPTKLAAFAKNLEKKPY
jgi:hypothetical protein